MSNPARLGHTSIVVLLEQVVSYNNFPMVRSDAMRMAKAMEHDIEAVFRCIELPEEPAGTVAMPYSHVFEQLRPDQPLLDLPFYKPANEH